MKLQMRTNITHLQSNNALVILRIQIDFAKEEKKKRHSIKIVKNDSGASRDEGNGELV